MAYFDRLERAAFGGIEFAWDDLSIRSSLRHHVHEYRRTAGGALEKQGRSLYRIRFSCVFDEALSTIKKPFANNYPEALYALRTMFENEETRPLIVPTLGTVDCCIIEFEQRAAPEKSRNGERVDITCLEDQSSRFLVDSLLIDLDYGGLDASRTSMLELAEDRGLDTNIFDAIQDAVDQVLAIRDTADMYNQLAAAKVLALVDIMREADRTITDFQNPQNHPVLEAFKVLWAQAVSLGENVLQKQATIHSVTTPKVMSIQDVSAFIYGRTDRAFDLLALNEFVDALAIPGGTVVRYFEAAA